MRWTLRLGRIFGIRIELHVTFLLFVAWIALSQGVARGSPRVAIEAAVLMLLVFACVLLHELGHALTARRYGIRTRDIILLPFGGVARLERMPAEPRQEMVVAIAGPLVNVGLAAILFGLRNVFEPGPLDPRNPGPITTLLVVNVIMVLFNLIPAFPMDGGRLLRAALAMRMPFERATRIASTVGQAIALAFGVTGLFTSNFMLMFIALFVFMAAAEERNVVQTRASLTGLPARAAMLTDFYRLDVREPLRRAVDYLMAGSQQDFPVVNGEEPVGILTRADLIGALQAHGVEASVGDAVRPDGQFAHPTDLLEDVMMRMRSRNRTAMPVLDRGRLVGLITLENVGDLLLVRDALKKYAASA